MALSAQFVPDVEDDDDEWLTVRDAAVRLKVDSFALKLSVMQDLKRPYRIGRFRVRLYSWKVMQTLASPDAAIPILRSKDGLVEHRGESWVTFRKAGRLLGLTERQLEQIYHRNIRSLQGYCRSGKIRYFALNDLLTAAKSKVSKDIVVKTKAVTIAPQEVEIEVDSEPNLADGNFYTICEIAEELERRPAVVMASIDESVRSCTVKDPKGKASLLFSIEDLRRTCNEYYPRKQKR